MSDLPDNISFETWVKFVFDHRGSEKAWYHKNNPDEWHASRRPLLAVRYMTQLFANAGRVLAEFSNLQLRHGLWFIADVSCSNHSPILFDLHNPVSPADRVKCIHAMYTLYEEVFARRCSSYLSHGQPTQNHLNLVCYMWWDLLPVPIRTNQSGNHELNEACLQVMTKTLELDSIACCESALHGLGHWWMYDAERISKIVAAFLKRNPASESGLGEYALHAQRGDVL